MDYSDSLLYIVGYNAGIEIFDPSLKPLGYSCYSGKMRRVIQKNNLIYTGNYGAGIRIFRETPDTIYEVTVGGQPYDVTDIALFDTLLYASSRCNGFYIFSIADSSNPVLVYQYSTLPDSLMSYYIAVDSNYIYISGYLGEDPLYILDRYDYSIVSITDSVGGRTFIRDTIGFIGDRILNLRDKTDPFIITNLSNDANALKDSLLYLDNGDLYSVARVDSPVLINTLDDGFGEFRGDSLYIIVPWDYYIIVYDISRPDSSYRVARGGFSKYRDWIEYAYPTLNRRILTDECLYFGFIEQGGFKEEEKTKIPSSIAVDYIHFNFKDKYSVSLYDITGRKILERELEGESRIYVKDISPGVYFIFIAEKNFWEKIIIMH
ncbi:T9SS type A sorting domain-containing protein [candidate division WOR-3 bacterium]|nr:T9SS type A sorting domain-containing protein [candidate division WOR-3 bacterium]